MIKLKLLSTLILILTGAELIAATTYYIAPVGSDTSGSGTSRSPWATMLYAFSHMKGGDILVLKDGRYTGIGNRIRGITGEHPPFGTSSNYTTIKAEHDGSAVIDGEGKDDMFYAAMMDGVTYVYWRIEGLVFAHGAGHNVLLNNVSNCKMLRCGAYDGDNGVGDSVNFHIGKGSSYVLLENCYAWGFGRYKFLVYLANHVILRNCVGRPDGLNASNEPCAVFSGYSSTYVKFQNCIAIDADQTSQWFNVGDRQGAFFVPTTSGPSQHIDFDQCIALNIKLGGITVASNYQPNDINFRNVVIWDCNDQGDFLNNIRGDHVSILGCTYGLSNTNRITNWDGRYGILKNTIFYHMISTEHLLYPGPTTQDYNEFYDNSSSFKISGTHNRKVNPIWSRSNPSGALKYLVQIERRSNLSGLGESGADIGANVRTLIGRPGSLWGDTGYRIDTSVSMWPFPNENLIKSQMATYRSRGVSGARGFCTGKSLGGYMQTLTRYIWEYLGNRIPPQIYGDVAPSSSTIPILQAGPKK